MHYFTVSKGWPQGFDYGTPHFYPSDDGLTLTALVPPQKRREPPNLYGWEEVVVAMWVDRVLWLRDNYDDQYTYVLPAHPKQTLHALCQKLFRIMLGSLDGALTITQSDYGPKFMRAPELDVSCLSEERFVRSLKGI